MAHRITPASEALSKSVLDALAFDLYKLRDHLIADEHDVEEKLLAVHPDHHPSARNLLHYLSLRRYDIRPLQDRLSQVGLSSLGRVEPHVMIALERALAMLALARQAGMPDFSDGPTPIGFRQGQDRLVLNSDRLLGPVGNHRKVRIMVTMPGDAADNPAFIHNLVGSGMSMARINCAHDDPQTWEALVGHILAAREAHGVSCRICMDLGGPKIRTGSILNQEDGARLERGDWVLLVPEANLQNALPTDYAAVIGCTVPEVFSDARAGEPIWFDDGTLGGQIEAADRDGLRIKITQAPPGGRKLRSEKGINLPGTALHLAALTAQDRHDLDFITRHADLVAMSFVNRVSDVEDLMQALDQAHASHLGLVLKIETNSGFKQLPNLLLSAMKRRDVGVMIARGDLAVESGFVRLAEVQEEILRIAEAAHVPTIWATQVLENLAKTGLPSRAEVTDAAMGVRAEAVMLNKGPYILEAVEALETILLSMQPHQTKKRSWLPQWKH
ncbi:MAG: pyruvate kinase [Bacteroidetes bacterium]|nr:pyruvate kinase [Bacteroidota bacterium]